MQIDSNPYNRYLFDGRPGPIREEDVSIFVPAFNTGSKADATGAFHPEAEAFCQRWKMPIDVIERIDNTRQRHKTAEALLESMEAVQELGDAPISIWAFFCHGYMHGIQFGIRSPNHPKFGTGDALRWNRFVKIISKHPAPTVVLYACSTGDDPDGDPDTAPGSGDGSFADYLRDELCKLGCVWNRVFAHTTAGHTSLNPNIKFFDGNGHIEGGIGSKLLAEPGTKEFRRLAKLLQGDFRFEAPFMTERAVRSTISKQPR